jgi:hypothetical protein
MADEEPVPFPDAARPDRVLHKIMPTTGLCRVEFRAFEFLEETEDLETAHAA